MGEDGAASVMTGARPGRRCPNRGPGPPGRRPNPGPRTPGRRRAFLLATALAAVLVLPALLALPHARSAAASGMPPCAGTTASILVESFPRGRASVDSRASLRTGLSAGHGRAQPASGPAVGERAALGGPHGASAGTLARIGHRPGRGMFLVAAPGLRDPNFARTVVLLLEYDESGALGLVINRPTEVALHDVIETPPPNAAGRSVFAGGPVELRRLIALLRSPAAVDGAERLFGDVHASGNMDTLRRMLERDGHAADLHAYLGYAGWAPGQLDAEIARGDWIVAPADAGSIFDTPPGDVWRNLMRRNAGRWVRAGHVRPA